MHIDDYGPIGDTQAASLVGRDRAADWLCPPRFDASARFAALLGADHDRLATRAPPEDGS